MRASLGRILLWTILIFQCLLLAFAIHVDRLLRRVVPTLSSQAASIRAERFAEVVHEFRLVGHNRENCSNSRDPLNYIIGTGQSLATGWNSNPALDVINLAWPESTFMTNLGILQVHPREPNTEVDYNKIVRLVPIASVSTSDDNGETIGAAMTWTINDLLRAAGKPPYPVVFSEHGVPAQPYKVLKKDTIPYDNALVTVGRIAQLVAPRCVIVRALTVTHGEADFVNDASQSEYEDDLVDWQRSFNADLKDITGQSADVVEMTDQMNSYTGPAWGKQARATSVIPLAQLQAAIDHPNAIILVAPKYFLDYTVTSQRFGVDGIHLTAASEQLLGEYYGKAFKGTVIDGVPWKPVYPTALVIAGSVITVTFNVPVAPLVLDAVHVTDPGNSGFEYGDNTSAPPTITGVALQGQNQVRVTLSKTPTAAAGSRFLSYAWSGRPGNPAGPKSGPRGNLRDSDNTVGRYSHQQLFNWCVTFHAVF
jgi:hypothetical protein